ncbi:MULTISPECIES: helix-turn-helix domain-containing protein [Rhodococcus]|jgi:transcriptional regulator with XRE-family HTH domain|uniref:helix-turn-helix domain-containing protein n=1 Tax=Rhodococcus TaxID=1827 RepID=UPI0009B90FFE|nr:MULTISPECIES: helix-turn-helix transcriptional regulator [Rhodococcus]MCJ0897737.1 helix-turn-helix domain-containing protein [Rhodococcus sp. ARC_M13]UKO86540.1 helix-turn-helix domain-containing protein [Rhodococcus erythropolis]
MVETRATPVSGAARVFGARVREARHRHGWSLETAAEHCGFHWTYLARVERGQRSIRLENIVRVAEGLGVDPGDLIAGITTDCA